MLDFVLRTRYGTNAEARYPSGKGEVCKTFMRRFDPDPRLQILQQLSFFSLTRTSATVAKTVAGAVLFALFSAY